MSYYINTVLKESTFEDAITKVTEELGKEGFGILNTIDMKQTLKNKLDVDFKRYTILGACNPKLAYEALKAVDKIGLMLPCNVVVEEHDNKDIEIAIVNPLASMSSVENDHLESIALRVRDKLIKVINRISDN